MGVWGCGLNEMGCGLNEIMLLKEGPGVEANGRGVLWRMMEWWCVVQVASWKCYDWIACSSSNFIVLMNHRHVPSNCFNYIV